MSRFIYLRENKTDIDSPLIMAGKDQIFLSTRHRREKKRDTLSSRQGPLSFSFSFAITCISFQISAPTFQILDPGDNPLQARGKLCHRIILVVRVI